MERQLIVVVHGVGVREAGVATAHLTAALREAGDSERPWKPHSTDDFILHEERKFAEDGSLAVFPAHMQRLRRYDPKDEQVVLQERLVADFYWGDISATGTGLVRLLIGLVKIVLGLSHAIRENAAEVFAGKSRRAIAMRAIARTAPLVIHGPIAAISIVLVVGLLWTLGWHALSGRSLEVDQSEAYPIISQLILGAIIILAARYVHKKSQVYLQRHLMVWLMITGALVIATAMTEWLAPTFILAVMELVERVVFGGAECMYRAGCVILTSGFKVLGGVLMAPMVVLWAIVILCTVLVQFATWAVWAFPERTKAEPMVAPAIALMTVLWFMLMLAVWAVILLLHGLTSALTPFQVPIGLTVELVFDCLRLVTPAVVTLVLVGIGAVWVQRKKGKVFKTLKISEYLGCRDTLAKRHRLIVARCIMIAVLMFPVLMTALAAITLAECRFLPENDCTTNPVWNDYILYWNDHGIETILVVVGLAAVLVGMTGRRELATAVAIATDVLVYLNDYSWMSREAAKGTTLTPKETPLQTRTLTEIACRMAPKADDRRQGYWLRDRIHSRMKVLVDTLIDDEKPQHIVIVSHSQGTVIAMNAVAEHGMDWLKRMNGTATLKLVTMGSPYTHIYNSYFPSEFNDLNKRTALGKREAKDGLEAGRVLSDWVNIFRVDDFVGTHIDTLRNSDQSDTGTGWPREVPIRGKGHTGYWVDTEVFPELRRIVAWNGLNGKRGPAAAG